MNKITIDNFELSMDDLRLKSPDPTLLVPVYWEGHFSFTDKENLIEQCKCGCKMFSEKVTDSIDWYETERNVICNNCGDIVNRWGYGYYENEMTHTEFKQYTRRKKLHRVLNV